MLAKDYVMKYNSRSSNSSKENENGISIDRNDFCAVVIDLGVEAMNGKTNWNRNKEIPNLFIYFLIEINAGRPELLSIHFVYQHPPNSIYVESLN